MQQIRQRHHHSPLPIFCHSPCPLPPFSNHHPSCRPLTLVIHSFVRSNHLNIYYLLIPSYLLTYLVLIVLLLILFPHFVIFSENLKVLTCGSHIRFIFRQNPFRPLPEVCYSQTNFATTNSSSFQHHTHHKKHHTKKPKNRPISFELQLSVNNVFSLSSINRSVLQFDFVY